MDITAVREVHESGCAKRVDGSMLDIVSAGMLVAVHDALNEKNQAHFAGLPLPKAVNLGWKLVK
jgi:hypothetical protein